MTLRFSHSVVGLAFGVDAASTLAGPQVPFDCSLLLSPTDGVIILSCKDAQADVQQERKLMFLTPANALVQRSDSRYLISLRHAEDHPFNGTHFSFYVALSPDAKHLSNLMDSAAANWPVQASVIAANDRYRCKVDALLRYARPSRCKSSGPRVRNFPWKRKSTTGTAGTNSAATANSTGAASPPAASDASGISGAVRARGRCSQPHQSVSSSLQSSSESSTVRHRAKSCPGSTRTHLLVVTNEERNQLQARTIALLQTAMGINEPEPKSRASIASRWRGTVDPTSSFTDGPISGSARIAFAEQANSVVMVYLPELLPWIKRYERLSRHLLPASSVPRCHHGLDRGGMVSAVVHTGHAHAAAHGAASVHKTEEQRLDKELVLVVSALCEAASCTMTSRNGLSRRHFKKLVHEFRDRALGERKGRGGAGRRELVPAASASATLAPTVQPPATRRWPKDGASPLPPTTRTAHMPGQGRGPQGVGGTARKARPTRGAQGEMCGTSTSSFFKRSSPPFVPTPLLHDDAHSSTDFDGGSSSSQVLLSATSPEHGSKANLKGRGSVYGSRSTLCTDAPPTEPRTSSTHGGHGRGMGEVKRSWRSTVSGNSGTTERSQAEASNGAHTGAEATQHAYQPPQMMHAPSDNVPGSMPMPMAMPGTGVPGQAFGVSHGTLTGGRYMPPQAMPMMYGQPPWQYIYSMPQAGYMPGFVYTPGPGMTLQMTPQGQVIVPNGYMGPY